MAKFNGRDIMLIGCLLGGGSGEGGSPLVASTESEVAEYLTSKNVGKIIKYGAPIEVGDTLTELYFDTSKIPDVYNDFILGDTKTDLIEVGSYSVTVEGQTFTCTKGLQAQNLDDPPQGEFAWHNGFIYDESGNPTGFDETVIYREYTEGYQTEGKEYGWLVDHITFDTPVTVQAVNGQDLWGEYITKAQKSSIYKLNSFYIIIEEEDGTIGVKELYMAGSDVEMYATAVDAGGDECPEIATEAYNPFTIPAPTYEGQREPQVGDYLIWDFNVANASGYKQILCEITSLDDRGEPYTYGVYMRAICFMAAASGGGSSENTLALVVGTQSADNLYDITESDLEGVTELAPHAFYKRTGLRSIELPDTITKAGAYAVQGCTNLQHAKLSAGMTVIPERMFELCSSLNNVTIPDGVTTINTYAFYNCEAFTEIFIPKSVTTLSTSPFDGCKKVTKVEFEEGSQMKNLSYFGTHLDSLVELILPEGLESMGMYCFQYALVLETVKLPSTLKTMNGAFQFCYKLSSIDLPEGLTTLGGEFRNCSALTEVKIPTTVTSLGSYFCGGTNTTVIMQTETPPSANSKAFYGHAGKIIVPKGCLETYQTATNWSSWASRMEEAAE